MKKDELLNIGLTEEQADKVFALNGKDIERYKKAAEDAKADKDTLEQQVADRDKDIAELKKSSGDAAEIQKKLDALQSKYDQETADYKTQLAQRDYQTAVDKAIADSGVKFSSKSAEKAFRAGVQDSNLEIKDGALDGFDKYLEKAKTEDPSAFVKSGSRIDQQGELGGEKRPLGNIRLQAWSRAPV